MPRRLSCPLVVVLLGAGLGVLLGLGDSSRSTVFAQCPTATGPDVVVGDLQDMASFGTTGGISAFAVGTTSCNVGTEPLLWVSSTNEHPVIGQNLFRLQGGILEQVGQSWLKHGFFAISMDLCCPGQCIGTSGSTLGVGCSDPYSANRNGNQSTLGPRSQVQPFTGFFPYPFSAPPAEALIGRRLQVPDTLLADSTADSDLIYIAEGHYVSPDDAAAGNQLNNVSNRAVDIVESGSEFVAVFPTGEETHREESAIERWAASDPSIQLDVIDLAGDGRIFVASVAQPLPTGGFQYEYAVYNMNADAAVGAFELPIPTAVVVESVGFHSVHHHSDEPIEGLPAGSTFSNAPWPSTQPGGSLAWSTEPFSGDPTQANPIRWSTMYNFRFTTDAPPIPGSGTLTTWKTGIDRLVQVQLPSADFVPAVTGLSCEYDVIANGTRLVWTSGEDYDVVRVRKDGTLVATLPGDAEAYFDPGSAPGSPTYSVQGELALEFTIEVECAIEIPDSGPNFQYRVHDFVLTFDEITGVGAAATEFTIQEDPDNVAYPNEITGFSMALTYDPQLLSVVQLEQGTGLPSADFFSAEVLGDGIDPSGGITVGAVISLDFSTSLLAETEISAVSAVFETVPATVAGLGESRVTRIRFEDGVHGAIPISGAVAVGTNSYDPTYDAGWATLNPGQGGAAFVRGDANDDGAVQISDAVSGLGYLFQGLPTPCLSALDSNDDGAVDVADVIYLLNFLFSAGPDLPSPTLTCGVDPTADSLDCTDGSFCP